MAGPAFWEGHDARLKGEALASCPHLLESRHSKDWLDGWHDEIMIRYFGDKVVLHGES